MAVILVVEDDGVLARHTAWTLRRLGHRPILAADARTARWELDPPPDLILLDLGVPDLPGEEFLAWLGARPETAGIPVLMLSARGDALARLRLVAGRRRVAVLRKPVADHHLDRAVTAALAPGQAQRRAWALRHLIATGPHRLAAHVYRRLAVDRVAGAEATTADALTWAEIGRWAVLTGVLDREQATLLRGDPPDGREVPHPTWPDGPAEGSAGR